MLEVMKNINSDLKKLDEELDEETLSKLSDKQLSELSELLYDLYDLI